MKILWSAHRAGARFRHVAALGRQTLCLHDSELAKLRAEIGNTDPFVGYRWGDYFEPYFERIFGCDRLICIDNNDYEGAEIIHDMNKPIPPELFKRFDLVIDGGSLEHIFNFPVAVANLMQLAKVGGRLITISPANNLCGHGFYQFTPELMYRVFSEENGFAVEEMVLSEHRFASVEIEPVRRVVRVRDPMRVGKRVMLVGGLPLILRMLAKRTSSKQIFTQPPQQSDYSAIWKKSARAGSECEIETKGIKAAPRVRARNARFLWNLRFLITHNRIGYDLSNREFFEPYV